jgi:hypothetical protein
VASLRGGDGSGTSAWRSEPSRRSSLEIGALVLDRRAGAKLRLHLVRISAARARSDGGHRPVPAARAEGATTRGVIEAALEALAVIGDAATARALEGLAGSLESTGHRWKAFEILARLAQGDANAALLRLWARADDADRAFLVGLVSPDEGEQALSFFEQASYAAREVRLAAAQAVGQFRFHAFEPFLDGWAARETDEEVRGALREARQTEREAPRWNAQRACGPPDARGRRLTRTPGPARGRTWAANGSSSTTIRPCR